MSRQQKFSGKITYQLLMSALGLILVVLMTIFPPAATTDVPWRKPVVGSIFSLICVLGVIAVFSPNKCLKIFSIGKKNRTADSESATLVLHGTSNALQGHHQTCGNYGAHVFRIKGRTVCAACAGLLLGGLLALVGASAYFFGGWNVADYSSLMVLLGIVGVSFGLVQFKFRSLVRLSVNTVFVLGSLLIIVGIDDLVHSLVFDLFVFCLIVFWLVTRISLSSWDHEVICSGCETENCRFRE